MITYLINNFQKLEQINSIKLKSEEMMKYCLQILPFLLILGLSSSYAQGKFGLGIILGEPTGVSAKVWMSGSTAVDGAIAWSFANKSALHIHADFLIHNYDIFSKVVPLYYGIGGRIKFREDDTRIGVRVPVGVAYDIPSTQIDLFLEIVPLLNLNPSTSFTMNGAIGGRFYF